MHVQPRLQCLTDLDVAISSANIGGPDGDLVEVVANLNHSTVDVVAELVKALSYQTQQNFEPVIVQVRCPLAFVEVEEPTTSLLVAAVFPHGLDARLEQRVVAPNGKLAGHLYVVVERPEVFNSVERGDLQKVLLPAAILVIPVEPQAPPMLKWVFDH